VNAIETITSDVQRARDGFIAIAPGGSATFEREAGFAIQCLTGSDYAMRIATENRQSVINAVTNIAAIGISLNPAKKQAYLVPRDGKICLDISYMGLLDLAIQSGSIRWGQAELVHQGEVFELNGFDKPPTHKRNPFAKDRGEIVGVYVVVKTADGDYLTSTMPIDEVFAIRDRTSSWKAWMEKKKKCPWVTDEGEMIKKTVIKRAYKLWPKTERLDQAIHYLNTEAGEGLAELASTDDPLKNIRIKPTDGAMGRLDIETQNYLRELADDVKTIYAEKGVEEAHDRVDIEGLDPDQMVALWSLFAAESSMRSALKRESKRRREAKPVGTEAEKA
jgi:recombination protein RecT